MPPQITMLCSYSEMAFSPGAKYLLNLLVSCSLVVQK